ncbi:anaerobic sulfite reductase subunit AsrB [Megasphaera sueciensis]|uniref:anaerobic sulfite reductase subunit AsrB n=1 Tax=Megasphaera sueciensis TaxID=349094 RepID=UPI003D037A90
MAKNEYLPFHSTILKVIRHSEKEYTFRMAYDKANEFPVKPGQFFEVSIPKYGEAPISVSGITPHSLDFTIRRVGSLTDEIFENYEGGSFFMRGPYGNGFDVTMFKDKDIVLVAGGSGLSPVHGVIDYFADHMEECRSLTVIAGFKSIEDVLFRADIARWKEDGICIIDTVDAAPEGYTGRTGMVTKYISELQFKNMANVMAVVVGPPSMIKWSIKGLKDIGMDEEDIWLSESRKMCCGLGKCGHCRIGDVYVCQDGPVFKYTKLRTLID